MIYRTSSSEKHKFNQNYVDVNLDNPIGTHGSRDEDEKPAKKEITQDDVEIEEKSEHYLIVFRQRT